MIGDTSAHFKDRDFWLRPQNSLNLMVEYFRFLGSSSAFRLREKGLLF